MGIGIWGGAAAYRAKPSRKAWLLWCRRQGGPPESANPRLQFQVPIFMTSGLLFCKFGLEMTAVTRSSGGPLHARQSIHVWSAAPSLYYGSKETKRAVWFQRVSQQREPSDQWQGHLGFSFSPGAVTIGSDSEIIVEALGHYLAPVGPLSAKNCGLACPLLWAGALPPHCPGSSWTEALSRGDLSWLACGCFHLG